MLKKYLFVLLQVGFGGLALVAIGVQLYRHDSFGFSIINFFSYFTNLSNIFAAVVLLIGAIYTLRGMSSRRFDTVRGASVLGIAVVGIVFSALLSNQDLGSLLPWVNIVLHYIMPVVVVGLWFVHPPERRLPTGVLSSWLMFPALYLAYSLSRGSVMDWYPYPFLNPARVGGYKGVAVYCLAIFGLFLVLGYILVLLPRSRAARQRV